MKKKLLWNFNNTLAKTMAAVMVCSAVTVGGSGFVFAEDGVTVAEESVSDSVDGNSESEDVSSDSNTESTNDENDSEENRGGTVSDDETSVSDETTGAVEASDLLGIAVQAYGVSDEEDSEDSDDTTTQGTDEANGSSGTTSITFDEYWGALSGTTLSGTSSSLTTSLGTASTDMTAASMTYSDGVSFSGIKGYKVNNTGYTFTITPSRSGTAKVYMYRANANTGVVSSILEGETEIKTSSTQGTTTSGKGSSGDNITSITPLVFDVKAGNTYTVKLGSQHIVLGVGIIAGQAEDVSMSFSEDSETEEYGTFSVAYTTVSNQSGTITDESESNSVSAASFTLTVTPEDGYDIDYVKLNNTEQTKPTPNNGAYVYTFTPSEASSVEIKYKVKQTTANLNVIVKNDDNATGIDGLSIVATADGEEEKKVTVDGNGCVFENLKIDKTYTLTVDGSLDGYKVELSNDEIKIAEGSNEVTLTISKVVEKKEITVKASLSADSLRAEVSGSIGNGVILDSAGYFKIASSSGGDISSSSSSVSFDATEFDTGNITPKKSFSNALVLSTGSTTKRAITFKAKEDGYVYAYVKNASSGDRKYTFSNGTNESETTVAKGAQAVIEYKVTKGGTYYLYASNSNAQVLGIDSTAELESWITTAYTEDTNIFKAYSDGTVFTMNESEDGSSDKLVVMDLAMAKADIEAATKYGFLFVSSDTAKSVTDATDKSASCESAFTATDSVSIESTTVCSKITGLGDDGKTDIELSGDNFLGVCKINGGSNLAGSYVNFIPYIVSTEGTTTTYKFGSVQTANF